MANDQNPNCIDTPVNQVLELFSGDLAKVSFPGVDASVLNTTAEQVRSKAAEVERLRIALSDARDALQQEQSALRDQARQAHAYARVFATGNVKLNEQLDAIVFDVPKARAPRKPRVRKPKITAPQLVLDSESPKLVVGTAT